MPLRNSRAATPTSPGPALKSETRTYTQNGDGLKLAAVGVNADGSAQNNQSWAAHFDGKDYPIVEGASDMITITMVGASTMDATYKKGGKVNDTRRFTVSKDGKTMTFWAGGTNTAGFPVSNFVVYDKQ